MESCFPPLASLSLRGNSGANKTQKNRHSTAGSGTAHQHQNDCGTPNNREFMPKLEVLQDLDLYYIRQIASSLKVNISSLFFKQNLYARIAYICQCPNQCN